MKWGKRKPTEYHTNPLRRTQGRIVSRHVKTEFGDGCCQELDSLEASGYHVPYSFFHFGSDEWLRHFKTPCCDAEEIQRKRADAYEAELTAYRERELRRGLPDFPPDTTCPNCGDTIVITDATPRGYGCRVLKWRSACGFVRLSKPKNYVEPPFPYSV